jgi:hypothetical protein
VALYLVKFLLEREPADPDEERSDRSRRGGGAGLTWMGTHSALEGWGRGALSLPAQIGRGGE